MRIDSTGNVGIGTTGPKRGLQIYGSNSVGSPELEITNTSMVSGSQNFSIAADTTGTDHWDIRTLSDDSSALSTAYMTFQHGGNVGIGTTSPSTLLHVSGTSGLQIT